MPNIKLDDQPDLPSLRHNHDSGCRIRYPTIAGSAGDAAFIGSWVASRRCAQTLIPRAPAGLDVHQLAQHQAPSREARTRTVPTGIPSIVPTSA